MYREIKNRLLVALISVPLFVIAAPPSPVQTAPAEAKSVEAQYFPTPDDAAKALLEAARSEDRNQIIALFGSHDAELLSSGDDVEDRNNRSNFVTLAQETAQSGCQIRPNLLVAANSAGEFGGSHLALRQAKSGDDIPAQHLRNPAQ